MFYSDSIRLQEYLELARRHQIAEVLEKPKIYGSKDVYDPFQQLSDCQYEEFWMVPVMFFMGTDFIYLFIIFGTL